MAYNILAINPGHNGSAALVSDGLLLYYSEEERFSRQKYDGNPFRAMLVVLEQFPIDELVIGGTTLDLAKLPWTQEDAYTALVRKFNPKVKTTLMGHQHHLGHAAGAFYNSGFDTAVAIVVDGAGSVHSENNIAGYETESIYRCEYPSAFTTVYKRYADGNAGYFNDGTNEFDNSVTITKAYEAVSNYLGFGFIEAGKTMGLAPYGRHDSNIPEFFIENKGNKNLLKPYYPAGAFVDEDRFKYLKRTQDAKEWHYDFSKVRDVDKNLAWRVQEETQKMVGDLIECAIASGEKNVVLAGGYGLNCVANYYYLERFPDINLYVDPVSHDGGTAIGLAKLAWYAHSQSQEKDTISTLYLGPLPDYSDLDSLLEKYNLKSISTTAKDVASLIENREIVALFNGRAEAGPRALGNRSILFDPRDPNGKDFVNRVKGREWFRPFAGSVLEEHAHAWFDLRDLQSSPFMMYAVNLQAEKIGKIPAVTHVDGTCRVQTVNKEQNPHYYDLINAFNEKTSVPLVFNTSFNLAGEPLVETLEDAFRTISQVNIKYLYLPELGILVSK